MQEIKQLNEQLQNKPAEEILSRVFKHFGRDAIAFASSLGVEDQVLTDMLIRINPEVAVFTIDTGYLPGETYELLRKTAEVYGFRYEVLSPDQEALELLIREHGPDLFYKSVDLRRACCHVRKVMPLQGKLATLKAWICGLRRAQAVTRSAVQVIEWDVGNGLVKVNPLVNWSEEEVWAYIKKNNVPYNALHDQGYPSIGCAPCTRSVKPGEGIRSGRWWWESPEHKECGLHGRHRKDQ